MADASALSGKECSEVLARTVIAEVLAACNRSDMPEGLYLAAVRIAADRLKRGDGVTKLSVGDISAEFESEYAAAIAPFRKIGTVSKD